MVCCRSMGEDRVGMTTKSAVLMASSTTDPFGGVSMTISSPLRSGRRSRDNARFFAHFVIRASRI